MNLYDILACPTCKVAVVRNDDILTCTACQRTYPIVNGVPVLFPDSSVPDIQLDRTPCHAVAATWGNRARSGCRQYGL